MKDELTTKSKCVLHLPVIFKAGNVNTFENVEESKLRWYA